jgi:hypothetical protein
MKGPAMKHEIIGILEKLGCTVEPCGSRATCNPAPTDTDEDYLVEVPWTFWGGGRIKETLVSAGFRTNNKEYGGQRGSFTSWRKDDINLIVTTNAEFAQKHRLATYVCKTLNLLRKADRVLVFQAILYGNKA